MQKYIIFDFGGVLIDWNPNYVYANYFNDADELKKFYTETGIFELNKELDRGLAFSTGLQTLAEQFPHYKEPILFWQERWKDMLRGPIPGTVSLLEHLYHQGYPLYGLTNWSTETFPYVFHKYEFFKYFKDILVSGKEGLIKPEREIFHMLLARNNLQAHECIFIDDNLVNINAAEALGITSIHFQDPDSLIKDLGRFISLKHVSPKKSLIV